MSPFRHSLVYALFLVSFQKTKSENDTAIPTTPEQVNLTHNSGSLFFKISIEKTECMESNKNETTGSTNKPPTGRRGGADDDDDDNVDDLGSESNPAYTCSGYTTKGYYYINPANSFEVFCDRDNGATCLNPKENLKEDESRVKSSAITLGDELWLSQTEFTLSSLYNKVTPSQISYLQSISAKVVQKIRYYYSTKDVKITPNVHLQALLWNDHLAGPNITKQMPFNYTVEKTDWCWGNATDSWVCSDITLHDNSNKRLPVSDFFIGQAKADVAESEPVEIYFELLELCFYK